MKRAVKDLLKRQLTNVFHVGQRLGFDVLPRHFYSEIPDVSRLRQTEQWRRPFSMRGVNGCDDNHQLAWLSGIVTNDVRQIIAEQNILANGCHANGTTGFGAIEADCLYAFVHSLKPTRIIQVGCGISTAICLAAAKSAGYKPELTCIDPYPSTYLSDQAQAGSIDVIAKPVESVDLNLADELRAGDLFFVDSTHTLGPAGEVTRLILETLPGLPTGAFAHFHDIFFPYDFEPEIMQRLFFWHETALLLAFLTDNPRFTIRASLSMLHHERPDGLSALFPRYHPMPIDRGLAVAEGHYPSSIYLEGI